MHVCSWIIILFQNSLRDVCTTPILQVSKEMNDSLYWFWWPKLWHLGLKLPLFNPSEDPYSPRSGNSFQSSWSIFRNIVSRQKLWNCGTSLIQKIFQPWESKSKMSMKSHSTLQYAAVLPWDLASFCLPSSAHSLPFQMCLWPFTVTWEHLPLKQSSTYFCPEHQGVWRRILWHYII